MPVDLLKSIGIQDPGPESYNIMESDFQIDQAMGIYKIFILT